MAEQQPTKHKQSPSVARNQRNAKRRQRIKDRKCGICGAQAWGKILLTQELRCAKHIVAPLKEELTQQAEAQKEKQACQSNAPSVANQTAEVSSATVAAT
jgi:hypothetical protein